MSNGGVLQFALGLEASQFLRNAVGAKGAIFGITAAATAAGAALVKMVQSADRGFMEAFREGAGLFDMSQQLNSSVGALYQLRSAFIGVHMPAEEATSMSLRLQRALSGVSEMGERTDESFALLGLNMRALRLLDPAAQFMRVASALGDVNAQLAPGIASNIFGRFSYGPALQIARQSREFGAAFRESAGDSRTWERLAYAFQRIVVVIDQIKMKFSTMWAEASRYFLVPLQAVLERVRNFNWQNLGHNIGIILGGTLQAFREGHGWEFLGHVLKAAFQTAIEYAWTGIKRLGIELLNAFGEAGIFLVKMMGQAVDLVRIGFAKSVEYVTQVISRSPLARLLGWEPYTANYAAARAGVLATPTVSNRDAAEMRSALRDMISGMRDRNDQEFGQDYRNMTGRAREIWDQLQDYARRAGVAPFGPANRYGPGFDVNGLSTYRPPANAMEKLGFIFNQGGAAPGLDYHRRTALATERITRQMTTLLNQTHAHAPTRNRA